MDLIFNVDYRASFGEQLILNIMGDNPQSVGMTTQDGSRWTYRMDIDIPVGSHLEYFYSVNQNGSRHRTEWLVAPHRLEFDGVATKHITTYDEWIDMPEDAFLYSSAVTDCLTQRVLKDPPMHKYKRTVRLKVRAPQLRANEWLGVVGDDMILGQWTALKSKTMYEHTFNEWIVDIDAKKFTKQHVEFKFVALDKEDDVTPFWETGSNRSIDIPQLNDGEMVVYTLREAHFDIYPIKCAGTQIPVFSLRSAGSCGVGDFGDLKMMIDWIAQTKQRVLQILPINDTTITHTWTDSYPYSCISVFALHPQYVNLRELPPIQDPKKFAKFELKRMELNNSAQVDYEAVNNLKMAYLRATFEKDKKSMGGAAYQKFFRENKEWLCPYALYCYYRDTYGTANFDEWPDHNRFDENDRKQLENFHCALYQSVKFYYYVQYVLYKQMLDVHKYARSKGVILKGDIPIGVNRHGCDVWMEPKYFNLNGQAGAPPDAFSVNGQNWGFPTYNWEEMLKDNCSWWERRFRHMSKFFDAYRIDHVLGFFRIWEIPSNSVHGLLGQFSPALGMTREEVESYGLHWQEDYFLRPYIADWTIDKIFGEDAWKVKDWFLNHTSGDRYEMKPEYDTQRKVEAYFADNEVMIANSGFHRKPSDIRDGLYSLISNVLFLRDHRDENKFHPRISAQLDFLYQTLSDSDKNVFNRLYNDYYYQRNNQFWYKEAMKKLPRLVQSTRMLVCAEDLGMVPECVAWVMNELRILTLEMQTMPKDSNVQFGHLSRNPYRSVCTFSSHDTPTLRQWWDEDYNRTQAYYNTMLHRSGDAPHPLPGWLAKDIISRQLTCPSMLCILTLQDWLAMDERMRLKDASAERINIPSNPKHYWRYRMHINIEGLLAESKFNDEIVELIRNSGRK